MKIKELMARKNRSLITVRSDKAVFEAIKKLNEFDRGSVPVVDERDELVGIITERDIIRKCFSPDSKFINPKIGDVMTKKVAVGFADDNLDYVVSVMRQKKIRHLPIVESNHKVIGVVSMRDILDALLSEAETEVRYIGMIPRRPARPIY